MTRFHTAVLVAAAAALGVPGAALAEAGGQAAASEMVVIPGGEFVMGRENAGHESPPHVVRVGGFLMDAREVTNAEYFRFCRETGRKLPFFWGMREFHSSLDFPDHPVAGVTWHDALDYATWAAKRLPTEAEWELAARGGLQGMRFSTGDTMEKTDANFSGSGTVRVGSFEPNGYGLYDMAGNVAEWVMDFYDDDTYASSPRDNPKGPATGAFSVVRGGGWLGGRMCANVTSRVALRPYWVDFAVGFRCARDLPGPAAR